MENKQSLTLYSDSKMVFFSTVIFSRIENKPFPIKEESDAIKTLTIPKKWIMIVLYVTHASQYLQTLSDVL